MNEQKTILVVEDSDEDFEAFTRACRKAQINAKLMRCSDGIDAFSYLTKDCLKTDGVGCPSILVIDLNMPQMDGKTLLLAIKEHAVLRKIPSIILTSSRNNIDIDSCYDRGANAYIVKSPEFNDFVESVKKLKQFWLETATLPLVVA